MENLCRDLSQVLISKYYSRSIAGGGALMSDQEEIKALLREIRDLHKEHLERYKEFTQDVLARQKTSSEELEQARLEQRRHRDEMRRAAKSGLVLRLVILGIAVGVVIVAIGASLLAHFFLPIPGPR
jgi:ferric-dicitrate binding protein FerR (iron transport regulator)